MTNDKKNAVASMLAYFCNDTSDSGQCPFQVIDSECKSPCSWSVRFDLSSCPCPCKTVTAEDWLNWMEGNDGSR